MTQIYFTDICGLHSQFLKMLQSHKGETDVLLFINRGKFWFPPKGDRVLVARRTNYMRKLLELSVLPTYAQNWQGGVGAGD